MDPAAQEASRAQLAADYATAQQMKADEKAAAEADKENKPTHSEPAFHNQSQRGI